MPKQWYGQEWWKDIEGGWDHGSLNLRGELKLHPNEAKVSMCISDNCRLSTLWLLGYLD